MKKKESAFLTTMALALWFSASLDAFAGQTDTLTAIKMGSNYYIQCQTLLQVGDERVLYFGEGQEHPVNINFTVYSESGRTLATVRNGNLESETPAKWILSTDDMHFTLTDRQTGRIICHVSKAYDDARKMNVLSLWVDLYLPQGFYFQCTPEETNMPELQFMTNSTLSRMQTALKLE
jgi:hypothetical protein